MNLELCDVVETWRFEFDGLRYSLKIWRLDLKHPDETHVRWSVIDGRVFAQTDADKNEWRWVPLGSIELTEIADDLRNELGDRPLDSFKPTKQEA